MTRSRVPRILITLIMTWSLTSGCYTFRSASADRTVWDELPNDPRPELWIEGSPRIAVVFEGVYSAMAGQEPALDETSTAYYRRLLHRSRIFTAVYDGDAPAPDGTGRIRMERIFRENAHNTANLTKAATVPGLLGYRFELEATLTLELAQPDGEPAVYEARSRITQIYHQSGRMDDARRLVYQEADNANTKAILHQLRADPELFDPVNRPPPTPATSTPVPL